MGAEGAQEEEEEDLREISAVLPACFCKRVKKDERCLQLVGGFVLASTDLLSLSLSTAFFIAHSLVLLLLLLFLLLFL